MKSIVRIICIVLLFWFSCLFADRNQFVYATISGVTCFWCFLSTLNNWLNLWFGNVVYHSFDGNWGNDQTTYTSHRSEHRSTVSSFTTQSIKEVETQLKNALKLREHKPILVSSTVKTTYEDGTPIQVTETKEPTITPTKTAKSDVVVNNDNNLVIINDIGKLDPFSEKVYKAIIGCLKSLITDKEKLWYLINSIKHIENMSSGTVIYTRPLTTKYTDTTLPYEEIVKAIHYHLDDKTHFVSFHELKTQTLVEYYFNENIKE